MLLSRAPADFGVTARFDAGRVFWLGFDPRGGLLPGTAWERELLKRLGAASLYAQPDASRTGAERGPVEGARPLPLVRVPTSTAEVRLAVRLAADCEQDGRAVLVLVPDEATADRFRAAARRNALPVARRD